MKSEIKLTKTNQSRLSEVDFDNIPFGRVFSDHMFMCDFRNGQWENPRIVPFDYLRMHPAAMVLHYGQAIFEGMKASVSVDGVPFLFRPELHATRLNASAERMCMPTFPEDLFVEALHQLIGLDKAWIPPAEGSALYVRPLMFANDEFIGVKPSQNYTFLILTGPVGPYYPKPVSLIAESKYIRAAYGGVGEAKTAGNYAASLLPARLANEKGYDQVLWLDSQEFKYIQEVGTMNIFFVIDGKVITPETDGCILRGITRDSALHLLRDHGYDVEVRKISIDEVVAAHKAGKLQEVFGTGTAAVVANVNRIAYNDLVMELPPVETHRVAAFVKHEINGIRNGTIEDKFGWLVPVKATEAIVNA